jgi:hypothetical protein
VDVRLLQVRKRIPITFEDPKISDNTPEQSKVYAERSLQIATEMLCFFKNQLITNATKTKIS